MKRYLAIGAIIFIAVLPARADDKEMQAYIASLFSVPGKAVEEFSAFSKVAPRLTAYSLSLFTESRCGTGKPSNALFQAGGGNAALGTDLGKKILIAAGVVGTMKFEDKAAEDQFCSSARSAIETALAAFSPK